MHLSWLAELMYSLAAVPRTLIMGIFHSTSSSFYKLEHLIYALEYGDSTGGDYYRYSDEFTYDSLKAEITVIFVLAVIAAVVLTVKTMEKKGGTKPDGFIEWLRDFLDLRGMILEVIVKLLYLLANCLYILAILFLLFRGFNFWFCLLSIILIPLWLRVLYEGVMILLLILKNVIDIDRRLAGAGAGVGAAEAKAAPSSYTTTKTTSYTYDTPRPASYTYAPSKPSAPPTYDPSGYTPAGAVAGAPKMVYCAQCGCRYDANKGACPSCGSTNPD